MNDMTNQSSLAAQAPVPLCHVIKGETVNGAELTYGPAHAPFTTPRLDLNSLTWPRNVPGSAFDVPLAEIMDLLVATGERLKADPDGVLAQALEYSKLSSPLPAEIMERSYTGLTTLFDRKSMEFQVRNELGSLEVLDGWQEVQDAPSGRRHRIRAFPPRLVHVIAGNSPGVAAQTLIRGALTKGVHLVKIPSNDLFTMSALLRTMAAVPRSRACCSGRSSSTSWSHGAAAAPS